MHGIARADAVSRGGFSFMVFLRRFPSFRDGVIVRPAKPTRTR
jgi:hypothetical protein